VLCDDISPAGGRADRGSVAGGLPDRRTVPAAWLWFTVPMRNGEAAAVELVSGEAVHLEVRLARAGSRALALMIDAFAQVLLAFIVVPVVTLGLGLILGLDQASTGAAVIISMVLIVVGYPTLIHTVTRGRSLGKLALGLRVVRDDGGPITLRHAFSRALVGATLEWPGVLLPVSWVVGLSILLTSPRAKRLADLTTGTIVIHERTPESWGWVPATPPPLLAWAATLDLTALDDQLALAARHFLARSRGLREPYRSRLGEALAKEILACTTPAPPPGTPGWAYLAAVVGERHRRSAHRLARNRASHAALWPELFPARPAPIQPAAIPAWPAAQRAAQLSAQPAVAGLVEQLRPAAPR
jgi:uncharacterized RDD family membrane protein YckC